MSRRTASIFAAGRLPLVALLLLAPGAVRPDDRRPTVAELMTSDRSPPALAKYFRDMGLDRVCTSGLMAPHEMSSAAASAAAERAMCPSCMCTAVYRASRKLHVAALRSGVDVAEVLRRSRAGANVLGVLRRTRAGANVLDVLQRSRFVPSVQDVLRQSDAVLNEASDDDEASQPEPEQSVDHEHETDVLAKADDGDAGERANNNNDLADHAGDSGDRVTADGATDDEEGGHLKADDGAHDSSEASSFSNSNSNNNNNNKGLFSGINLNRIGNALGGIGNRIMNGQGLGNLANGLGNNGFGAGGFGASSFGNGGNGGFGNGGYGNGGNNNGFGNGGYDQNAQDGDGYGQGDGFGQGNGYGQGQGNGYGQGDSYAQGGDGYGQGPANNYGQGPANNYGQGPANNYGQDMANNYGQDMANNYGQDMANNYGQGPANTFPPAPTNNFPPGPTNTFPPSQVNTFPQNNEPVPHTNMNLHEIEVNEPTADGHVVHTLSKDSHQPIVVPGHKHPVVRDEHGVPVEGITYASQEVEPDAHRQDQVYVHKQHLTPTGYENVGHLKNLNKTLIEELRKHDNNTIYDSPFPTSHDHDHFTRGKNGHDDSHAHGKKHDSDDQIRVSRDHDKHHEHHVDHHDGDHHDRVKHHDHHVKHHHEHVNHNGHRGHGHHNYHARAQHQRYYEEFGKYGHLRSAASSQLATHNLMNHVIAMAEYMHICYDDKHPLNAYCKSMDVESMMLTKPLQTPEAVRE